MKYFRVWILIGLGVLCFGVGGVMHASHSQVTSVVASTPTTLTPATGMPWES